MNCSNGSSILPGRPLVFDDVGPPTPGKYICAAAIAAAAAAESKTLTTESEVGHGCRLVRLGVVDVDMAG